ncbi:patatin-like phospholipase family protein [Caulobacter segnis]|uniref:patatin-like phospholipase family protein n=1 Tax=Caulobacter segnis TaxID=88688 RepID=UPI001CC06929|nr:patatin-like phospholipase family protein [Caulobacter segnis]UAL08973.1 patatin-like phospholipase family protein [Caulobacter segnis]
METPLPDDSALARLFARERRTGAAAWFSLPGGATLFEPGEDADHLYFLKTGRLGAFRKEEGQEPQFLGVIRPGEPAGEMALVGGTPHSANMVALRDSEVLALPREDFFEAAEEDPTVMLELSRLMIRRARQAQTQAAIGDPSVFGFIAVEPGAAIRPIVERLARCIESLGYSATVEGGESLLAPTEWFSNVEREHDFVLYVAEADETAWKHVVGRQVDRLFRVGRGDRAPPAAVPTYASGPLQAQRLVDLILLQSASLARPSGSAAWMEATQAARLFHLRENGVADLQRLARVLTGQSVGLVLSGGGARAYAHIGAIQAMRERGIPIDFVGGASMGGIVAAGIAMGWDDGELEDRIRRAFVDSSPLDDIAFPMIAMTRGEKVKARLDEHFGTVDISDLWLPFFCVSSNLTSGAYHLHRTGDLQTALRASISLPGVLPPATEKGQVLVDGAVMKNFPADVMRSFQLGPIVGVDVTRGRSITSDDIVAPPSLWSWILSGEWRKGPPIVALLMRAATVTTGRDLAAAREATDVLITPKLEGIDIRDWRAFEPAVKAGYIAASFALEGLHIPVTELRRRPSLAERRAGLSPFAPR